jgi:hypothetical protein
MYVEMDKREAQKRVLEEIEYQKRLRDIEREICKEIGKRSSSPLPKCTLTVVLEKK